MARRNEPLLASFLMLPWWVSAIAAAASYLGLTYLAPLVLSVTPIANAFDSAARTLAPLIGGLFVITAAGSRVRALLVARKFDQQSGIADIRKLSWQQFEVLIGEAFRRRGYAVVENGGGGADGGVDLILRKDGKTVLVQCKHWKVATVGVKSIRELYGIVSARKAAGGIFVNSGSYTSDTEAFAAEKGIELIDGTRLIEMVWEAQMPEPFMEPTNWGSRSNTTFTCGDPPPQCPSCRQTMVLRAAKRGSRAGSQFWGCSGFPRCRATRECKGG